MRETPFEILGVDIHCADADVKVAYRRLALRYHPDRSKESDAEEKFKRVQLAYQMIRLASRRDAVRRILENYGNNLNKVPPRGYSPYKSNLNQQVKYTITQTLTSWCKEKWTLILLKLFLLSRLERVPMNCVIMLPIAFFLSVQVSGNDAVAGIEILPQVFTVAFIAALVSDYMITYVTTHNRYKVRMTLNTLTGYVALFTTAILILSINLGGVAVLPELMGLNDVYVRTLSWWVLSSAVYLWVVFCFLFQKSHTFYETLFVWIWIASAQYMYIVII